MTSYKTVVLKKKIKVLQARIARWQQIIDHRQKKEDDYQEKRYVKLKSEFLKRIGKEGK